MKVAISLIYIFALLFPLNCSAKNSHTINDKTVRKVMRHFFSADVKLGDDRLPYYRTGDFNCDGMQDIAILFYPHENKKLSKQIQSSWPWAFNGDIKEKLHKSLAIVNGHQEGWVSPNTKVYAFFDNSGVLETPSFHLIVKKRSENDYAEHMEILPVPKAGDLIILPTEAGIDTYVFWNKFEYELHIPEEEP